MVNNYVKLFRTPHDKHPQIVFFDDKDRQDRNRVFARTTGSSYAKVAVFKRPKGVGQWDVIPEVGEGPTWTEAELAAFEQAERKSA